MSTRRTTLRLMAAAAVVVGMVDLNRVSAQSAAPTTERLALKGYDPVAYFTDFKPTPGAADYEYVWDGQRYRFASARHRDLFKANPDKYAPQFGGSCAMNMSSGVKRESDPNNWVISNGKLYVFAGLAGMESFRKDPDTAATKAATNWKSLKNTATQ